MLRCLDSRLGDFDGNPRLPLLAGIPHKHIENHDRCFRLCFFVVIIGYRSTQLLRELLPHLLDIMKLVKNGLLTGSCMRGGRSKRKCTVSPVDCNVLMTHRKTYQKRQWRYQNGF